MCSDVAAAVDFGSSDSDFSVSDGTSLGSSFSDALDDAASSDSLTAPPISTVTQPPSYDYTSTLGSGSDLSSSLGLPSSSSLSSFASPLSNGFDPSNTLGLPSSGSLSSFDAFQPLSPSSIGSFPSFSNFSGLDLSSPPTPAATPTADTSAAPTLQAASQPQQPGFFGSLLNSAESGLSSAGQTISDGYSAAKSAVGAAIASPTGQRVMGGLEMLGGVGEGLASGTLFAAGTAADGTGVGALAGVPAQAAGVAGLVNASDHIVTGFNQLISGTPQQTVLSQAAGAVATDLGASPSTAQSVQQMTQFGQGLAGIATVAGAANLASTVPQTGLALADTGLQTPSAASTLAINSATGAQAEIDAAADFGAQGLQTTPRVSFTDGSIRAVPDIAISGTPGATVQVPAGFAAEDLSGAPLLDANGQPITSFTLNGQGQAVVEVKTGGATLTNNQATVYPGIQAGTATGVGQNAAAAGMAGPIQSTPVIVIRR
jgi:hypothetical protein